MLPSEVFLLLIGRSEQKRIRLILFIALHISFNSLWLLNLSGVLNSWGTELAMMVNGGIAIVFYQNYWVTELNPLPVNSRKQTVWLTIHLSVISLLVYFIGLREIFVLHIPLSFIVFLYAQSVFIYLGVKAFLGIVKKREIDKVVQSLVAASCCLVCLLPFFYVVIGSFEIKYFLVNSGFFCLAASHLRKYYLLNRMSLQQSIDQLRLLGEHEDKSRELSIKVIEDSKKIAFYRQKLEDFDVAYKEQSITLCECQNELNNLKQVNIDQAAKIAIYENILKSIESRKDREARIEGILDNYPELTVQQRHIAKLIGLGLSHREISDQLNIAYGTVTHHSSVIYRKTGVKSLKQLKKLLQK